MKPIIDDNYVPIFGTKWHPSGPFVHGYATTPHGMVHIFLYEGESDPCLHLHFLKGGRMYRRVWNRRYSRRYAVTLAKRFAKEITESI